MWKRVNWFTYLLDIEIFDLASNKSKVDGCSTNECWCVSSGGKTCNYTFHPDECYDRNDCPGDGYWCDDSKDAGCDANECWCVSNGGTIVNDTCRPDECNERTNCLGGGYWCDDSGNMIFIIKCRKYIIEGKMCLYSSKYPTL